MSTQTVKIDGGLTLKQTESRCEVEQESGFQLDSIKFGTDQSGGLVIEINNAEFHSENALNILNELDFVQLDNLDPDDLKKKRKSEGWTFICDSQLYVQNHIKRVFVFGKIV